MSSHVLEQHEILKGVFEGRSTGLAASDAVVEGRELDAERVFVDWADDFGTRFAVVGGGDFQARGKVSDVGRVVV